MIRVFHVHFPGRTLLLALSEMLIVILAILPAAFFVLGADAGSMFVYQDQLLRLLLVVAVCMMCMHYYDLYDSMILFNRGQGITRVIQVLGSACVILALLYYFYPVVRLNQDLLMIWLAVAGVSLVAWRRLFLAFNRSPRLMQKTLLLGAGPLASQIATVIRSRPELGMRVAGYAGQESLTAGEAPLPRLGQPDDIADVLERHRIERVIVAMEDRRGTMPVEELLTAKARGVIVDDGANFFEAVAGRVDLASLRPTMLLFSEGFHVSTLMRFYKRAASILGSLAGLIVTLPVMALVAIAIRLDSPGPIIFRQRRIGKEGKPFTLFKFRSMYQDADNGGATRAAQENDSRCTRVGKFLRRSRLDELPQLFNILRGDMHFIGPRPFAADMEEELARQIPFYSKRWTVNPGATGWAQVRKGYNETLEDNVEKLTYDLYYIKNLSVGLDFLVFLETIKILLLGRGSR